MMEPPEQAPNVHPTVLALPWYVSGQLREGERLAVERHLQDCAECQRELDSVSALRSQLRAMFAGGRAPSERLKGIVMSRLRKRRARTSVFDWIAEAARTVLQPKWAPGFALLLIVGQLGALAWLATKPAAPPGVTTRSADAGALRVQIVFNSSASVRDVQDAIRSLGGRIVDGPTAEGAYVVELPSGSPQENSARLRVLRERPGLVERIEALP